MSSDEINFSAKYKNWICVKKLAINENTAPAEIVAAMVSARESMDKKSFEILGINTGEIEQLAESLTKGKRKSYSAIAEVFGSMKPGEIKAKLLAACNNNESLVGIAEQFLLRKILGNLNYSASITTEALQDAFPELKIPKPRGRFK